MEFDVFEKELLYKCIELNIKLSEEQVSNFYDYMNLLLEWNGKMNLTSIVEPKEIILKHFIDSLIVFKYIKKDCKVADIGTGAGFPGLPIAIANKECNITLIDSLNKRIGFLNEVIKVLNLNNVNTIHSRAEDIGKDKLHREGYDFVISRAVAPLNVLLEYMLPLVRVGGFCICMKAFNIDEEVKSARKAVEILGGRVDEVIKFQLPDSDINRSFVRIVKVKSTGKKYPRKAGLPAKEPLK